MVQPTASKPKAKAAQPAKKLAKNANADDEGGDQAGSTGTGPSRCVITPFVPYTANIKLISNQKMYQCG